MRFIILITGSVFIKQRVIFYTSLLNVFYFTLMFVFYLGKQIEVVFLYFSQFLFLYDCNISFVVDKISI